MEDYGDTIAHLGTLLADIARKRDQPMTVVGNLYRQTAEAICKSIIIGYEQPIPSDLDKMIADSHKLLLLKEVRRDAEMFRNEARYLQGTGNTFSHVGQGSGASEREHQNAAFESLRKAIYIAFFSNGDLDPPALSEELQRGLPSRLLQRANFESLRPEEVVRVWMTKQVVTTKIKRTDRSTHLVYDYIEATVTSNVTVGALFLRSRSSLEKSISDCFQTLGAALPSSLHIVTPRAYRPDGRELDRQKSIWQVISGRPSKDQKIVTVSYFDEFVWNNCLPVELRGAVQTHAKTAHIIPQSIERVSNTGTISAPILASDYIGRVLTNSSDHDPVQVVIGPAGIGKTTFCDGISHHIASQPRKRVVLLSATDFREVVDAPPVKSVSDLYRLAADHGFVDAGESIDSHNFEINLGCGNFVLLIDGFDELESHLGEALDFEAFMHSLTELEDCFRKVLVILTVRDYDVDRFMKLPQTSILRLRGFSEDDTERYWKERLSQDQVGEARTLLRNFSDTSSADKQTVPLYASLICDYLLEKSASDGAETLVPSSNAKSFAIDHPLDKLVRKIVDREIAKQSLGDIGPDDFFDVLIEVIRSPQSSLPLEKLADYVGSCGGDADAVTASNFLRNPFLRRDRGLVSFKYDSLSYFFKSRLLARRIREGRFQEHPSVEFMAEFARGDGALFDEIKRIFPASEHANTQTTIDWFSGLLKGWRQNRSSPAWRRAISAFMYWALDGDHDKNDRTATLSSLFGGALWEGFSTFGRFYPLNLNGISIHDGHIENFGNLAACDFEIGTPVFHGTFVDFDDRSVPEKLDRGLFASDCIYSQNLQVSFHAKDMADDSSHDVVRDNIYKILKVGFRANRFSWKSRLVYRNVTVVGRHSLDTYLEKLVDLEVLRAEGSNAGVEQGYTVTEKWQPDARKLIEEKNLTSQMAKVVATLTR